MATHTQDYAVERIAWESTVPIDIALARLDKAVKADYQAPIGNDKPKHFEDLLHPALALDPLSYEDIKDVLEPARGDSGYILDHNHHSHEYRNLYNPEAPYLQTHLYSLVPPPQHYSVIYLDPANAILFPHRVLVLERPNGTASVHYDQPSSQIDLLGASEELERLAKEMDDGLDKLIRHVLDPQLAWAEWARVAGESIRKRIVG